MLIGRRSGNLIPFIFRQFSGSQRWKKKSIVSFFLPFNICLPLKKIWLTLWVRVSCILKDRAGRVPVEVRFRCWDVPGTGRSQRDQDPTTGQGGLVGTGTTAPKSLWGQDMATPLNSSPAFLKKATPYIWSLLPRHETHGNTLGSSAHFLVGDSHFDRKLEAWGSRGTEKVTATLIQGGNWTSRPWR